MTATTVIVGAGQAGADLAVALRQQSYPGRILLIGEEPVVPYRRPPLSKGFLLGDVNEDALCILSGEGYSKRGIELRTGLRVECIDRADHNLNLSDGSRVRYDNLALTTGGRARKLELPGVNRPNVHSVRTLADIRNLSEQFKGGKRLVIVGGGYIGLEVASVAVKTGLKVTLVESLPRLLARVTGPELSQYYAEVHRRNGVEIRLGASVCALEGAEHVETVILQDGTRLPADIVIVGIGLIPNTELAAQAGLAVDNGILVDLYARTSDPHIVAAGDCTNHVNGFLRCRVRLESVSNASEQARVAAATICGQHVAYASVPWFWSDQYNLKLQTVGLSQGYDRVVLRGVSTTDSFTAFYLKDGVVIAADSVNRPQDFVMARKIVAGRLRVNAAFLADETVPLKTFLTAGANTCNS